MRHRATIPGREFAQAADDAGAPGALEPAGGPRLRCWSPGLAVAVVLLVFQAVLAVGPASAGARTAPATSSARAREVLLPVWALLDGSTPVSGGHVSVYAGLPQRLPRTALVPLDRRHVTSNAHGVVTLDFAHLPRTFTVVIRGGHVGRQSLRGSLSAQVHGYAAGSPVNGVSAGPVVHLNPVTTLIDAWQHVDPRVSEARAQRTIDRALGIPAWADASDLRVNDQWLDGKILLKDIRARGTLDRATGDLVVEIRTGKHVVSFRAPHRAHAAGLSDWWQNTDVGQLVKDGLSSLGVGVAEGLGVAGANWVLAKFLDAVGLGKFADFLFPITKMINQLNAIAAQVTAVKGLVEQNILATEHGQYNQLVASIRGVGSDIGTLWDDMTYEANLDKNDPTLVKLNGDLIGHIGSQLVDARSAIAELNNALAPPEPLTYGILQAASAYLGSRKPFFTQASSKAMGPVFDYYQLMQLRLSILLTNYYSTRPDTFSPTTIQDTVINKIAGNIAGQRKLLKPALPPGTFIDLRTDKNATMLMWGPVAWVNGLALEHYCVDQRGVRHRFYVNVGNLTCDPPGHSSAAEGLKLATEPQFKALLDGWTAAKSGDTPLMWLQKETGLAMTAAPKGTAAKHIGFYWVGQAATPANRAGPVEGPFCKVIFCLDDNTLGYYEYLHRYDMQDTSTPSPDAWTTSLFDLDPQNYDANAVEAPTPVPDGTYFWPVGG